jgi:hypothetical protein
MVRRCLTLNTLLPLSPTLRHYLTFSDAITCVQKKTDKIGHAQTTVNVRRTIEMIRLKIDLALCVQSCMPHALFAFPFRRGNRLYRHTSLSWPSRASGDPFRRLYFHIHICIGSSL